MKNLSLVTREMAGVLYKMGEKLKLDQSSQEEAQPLLKAGAKVDPSVQTNIGLV
jgi:hypothetical protein